MEHLLNKTIVVPRTHYPRPASAIAEERAAYMKRHNQLLLTSHQRESYIQQMEEARLHRLMNKLAQENL